MGLKLNGSSSGSVELNAPADTTSGADVVLTLPVNDGDADQVLTTNGSGTLSFTTPTVYTQNALGAETATTSGTSVEWTSLPTWVRQIIVSFNEVSTAGACDMLVQLGDSTDYITSGYISTSGNNSGGTYGNSTSGFITDALTSGQTHSGHMIITKVADDAWAESGSVKRGTASMNFQAGSLNGSGTITRIRVNLTASSFDAGSIGIWYLG